MTIRDLRADLAAWPGSRGFYGVVAMIGFAAGFWLSVLAGPGFLFGRVTYPEPRPPGIVTVTVPAPPAPTPTTDLPVAGERTGRDRRSNPVTSRRSGPTTTEVPAESKGRASVMQSPPPGPSTTTTTNTTTTTSPTTTTTSADEGDDDEDDDD